MKIMSDTCGKGHPYPEHLYVDPRGKRQCRECRRLALKRNYDKTNERPGKGRTGPHSFEVKWSLWEMDRLPVADCWEWPGSRDRDGYGMFSGQRAHRRAYEMLVAPIPPDMTVDHLCRNTGCVNPSHMEIVTAEENSRRMHAARTAEGKPSVLGQFYSSKTHCPQGHPYSGDNLRIDASNGARRCKICDAAKSRRYQAKKRKSA